MTQARPYLSAVRKTYDGVSPKYIYDDPLRPGEVARIRHVSAKFTGIATTQYARIGIADGESRTELASGAPPFADGWVHFAVDIWLKAGQRIYAYLPDVSAGQEMALTVSGVYQTA